jgi:hypothetical protein
MADDGTSRATGNGITAVLVPATSDLSQQNSNESDSAAQAQTEHTDQTASSLQCGIECSDEGEDVSLSTPLSAEISATQTPNKKKRDWSTRPRRKWNGSRGKLRDALKDDPATQRTRDVITAGLLAQNGIKRVDIAEQLGVGERTVAKYIAEAKAIVPDLKELSALRPEMVAGVEVLALGVMAEKLTSGDCSLKDATYTFKETFHAGRLERGQSTQNTSVQAQCHTVVSFADFEAPPSIATASLEPDES